MGVPSFYRWLVDKYPKIVVKAIEDVNTNIPNPNGIEFDNFYLDMNGIIHPCFHPDDDDNSFSTPTTFEDVFKNIFSYIDRLVTIVRPRKLLYMAMDGVAPRANMNQQRARRFRTAKDNRTRDAEEERLRKQFEMEGKQVLPKQESQVLDSTIITPGTEFMHEVSKALQSYISSRIASNSLWRDMVVILSDANVPGEGEHKIMSYIRSQRSFPDYDPNTRHCLCGLDADLIMLALSSHEPHFSILREVFIIQEQQPQVDHKPFEFLHIWVLREYLELDMMVEDLDKNDSIDLERIIDDFIFMCFFAGNDFLPHLPSLEIHEGAIDLLMNVYKKQFKKIGGYLVDMSRVGEKKAAFVVKLSRVEKFILMVGAYEEKIFKKRSELRERKLRRLVRDHEDAKQEQDSGAFYPDFDKECSSDCTLLIDKERVRSVSSEEILQNTKDLKEQVNKCIRQKCDLFKSGEFLIDKIKLGTAGFKERYYKEKFYVEGHTDIESKRKEIVQKYTEGLVWVLQYYFSGVASWSWFYPYHYGPFVSDLKGMGQVRCTFEKGVPFSPYDQLLSVLPPRSAHALPDAYAQLMLDEQSPIYEYYPLDFEVDTEGKRFLWQGICKLPFIDDRLLLAETRKLKKELSENEEIRNSVKVDNLFVRSTSKLGAKIRSLSSQTNPSFMLESSISDGIAGVLSLCHEGYDKPCSGIRICDSEQKDHVLCVDYGPPVGSSCFLPRLLCGLNLPTKTVFGADIMETELWHERQRQGSYVRGNNSWGSASKFPSKPHSQDNRRRFSTYSYPQVIHKDAGVGWGSGRGNARSDTMPQQFVDCYRHFGTSEPSEVQRSFGRAQFRAPQNGFTNVCNNVSYQGSQSGTRPYGRGRGAVQHNTSNFGSWRSVSSSSSLRPQGNGAKGHHQGKDQNRW